jgi:hypothetical protein
MDFTKSDATAAAKHDLVKRLGVVQCAVEVISVTEKDFPDLSLGAPVSGDMSAQIISTGWEIKLGVESETYEYRADKYQLRLVDFDGQNFVIDN